MPGWSMTFRLSPRGTLISAIVIVALLALWNILVALVAAAFFALMYFVLMAQLGGLRGDSARAMELFDRMIARNPQNASAYLNRGVIYANKGDLGQAIEDL